jgi:hypothetical protein
MTYYLHLRLRDCIPERYVIRTLRAEHINPRTNDETKVIGEFATAVEAYDAAASRGDAPIYKGFRGDFDVKVFGHNDLEGTV